MSERSLFDLIGGFFYENGEYILQRRREKKQKALVQVHSQKEAEKSHPNT